MTELSDMSFKEVNDQIYAQLKARYLANPNSLSRVELQALAAASTVRYMDITPPIETKIHDALQWVWTNIEKCERMIKQYEAGDYKGDFEGDYLDVWGDDAMRAEEIARTFGDDAAIEKIYQLDYRYLQITGLMQCQSA